MNKRYDHTDEERDQSNKLEREQAEKQKSRQSGDPRQEGGWQTDKDRRRSPHEDDSGKNGSG